MSYHSKKSRQHNSERAKNHRAKIALDKKVEKYLEAQLQNEEQLHLQVNDRCLRFAEENKDLKMSNEALREYNVRLERMADNLMWGSFYSRLGFMGLRYFDDFLEGIILLLFIFIQFMIYLYLMGFI